MKYLIVLLLLVSSAANADIVIPMKESVTGPRAEIYAELTESKYLRICVMPKYYFGPQCEKWMGAGEYFEKVYGMKGVIIKVWQGYARVQTQA